MDRTHRPLALSQMSLLAPLIALTGCISVKMCRTEGSIRHMALIVTGHQRSGTILLARLFDAHPEVRITGELAGT